MVVNRGSCEFGYLAVMSNSKFTMYYIYVDQEMDDEDEDEEGHQERGEDEEEEFTLSNPPKIQVSYDKLWEVTVSYIHTDSFIVLKRATTNR